MKYCKNCRYWEKSDLHGIRGKCTRFFRDRTNSTASERIIYTLPMDTCSKHKYYSSKEKSLADMYTKKLLDKQKEKD